MMVRMGEERRVDVCLGVWWVVDSIVMERSMCLGSDGIASRRS